MRYRPRFADALLPAIAGRTAAAAVKRTDGQKRRPRSPNVRQPTYGVGKRTLSKQIKQISGKGRSRGSASPLFPALAVHAQKRVGQSSESGRVDGPAASLARPIGTVVDAAYRPGDLIDQVADVVADRKISLPIECCRASIGEVLVESHLAAHVRLGRVERVRFELRLLSQEIVAFGLQRLADRGESLAIQLDPTRCPRRRRAGGRGSASRRLSCGRPCRCPSSGPARWRLLCR